MGHASSEPEQTTQTRKQITMVIETQIAGYHPGVILLQEWQAQSGLRQCDRGRLLLWTLGVGDRSPVALMAECIYDDQVRVRRGKAGGQRWDFRLPCSLRLVQRIGQPASSNDPEQRTQERDLGTLTLPGGQDRAAVCALLARCIGENWQAPPQDAYLPPALLASPGGTVLYDQVGSPFDAILRVESNHRVIEGPLVFVGAEHWGIDIDQIALLTAGHDKQGTITHYYHLFEIAHAGGAKVLCDRGIYPLTHDLELPLWPDEEDEGPYLYWQASSAGLSIYGGTSLTRAKEIRRLLDEAQRILGAALYNRGVFCQECARSFRPALGKLVLQEAAALGYVTTLCPHTWWCAECGRWSTPDERSPLVTWSGVCEHARPDGWESRLTNDGRAMEYPRVGRHLQALLEQQPPHPYYGSAAFQEAWLPGMVFPPRWAVPPADLLSSRRNRAGEEPLRFPGDDESPVLVTFLEDAVYRSGGEQDFVPAGTRLIGEWAEEQPPEEEQLLTIVVNGITWNLNRSHVRVTDPPAFLTQQHIAQESRAAARARAAQGDDVAAQALYARAIVELEAAGEKPVVLAHVRTSRANCLVSTERDQETLAELERAARIFEEATQDNVERMFGGHRYSAYHAANVLSLLALIALYRTHEEDRARLALERLLAMHALLGQHFDLSVDVLAQAAQIYLGLGEEQEAGNVLTQAERLYEERLAPFSGLPHISQVAGQLRKARQRLRAAV